MKKKILLTTILISIFSFKTANAADVSISANTNYPTAGSKVTFYINIKGAAAWELSGSGSGATTNCQLGEQGVGDSGTGNNTNKTLTVSCPATSVGQISFSVTGNISSASGSNITTKSINTHKIVVVQAPRAKDSNNDLTNLKVGDYKLSPSFNKDTLEYSVDVPSTVNKVNIEASKASNYSSIEGTGEKEVNEGANLFEIKVTSETGIEKTYKLTVNVKDENPIDITINNSKYTIIKNAKTLTKPETYENTTIKIDNFDIPAFQSEITKLTLVGVKDAKGTTHLAIYDKQTNKYELYNEIKTNQQVLYIKAIPEVWEGFTKQEIKIANETYEAMQNEMNSNYTIIYAMNIINGEENYYLYDKENNSAILYHSNDSNENNSFVKEQEKYKKVIVFLAGTTVLSVFLNMILLLKKLVKSNKKINIKILKLSMNL